MSLKKDMEATLEGVRRNAPPEVVAKIDAGIAEIAARDIAAGAAKVGDSVPDFELPNATGQPVKLSDVLAGGPALLTFYRGGWCPYCSVELKAYRDIQPEVEAAAGTLIAISPELPDNSLDTAQKNEIAFPVLSDTGNEVARSLGLVFRLPQSHVDVHHAFEVPLDKWNGEDSWELPLPATLVIAPDSTVAWISVGNDYRDRAEPSEALAALRKAAQ